jgi:uncharacterized protein (DUF736 family)
MSNYDNTNSGVLFKNDKKGNEKAPDYKGKVNIEGKEKEIAGWIREGKSGKFISIKISEPMKKDNVFDNKPKNVFDNFKSTDLPF